MATVVREERFLRCGQRLREMAKNGQLAEIRLLEEPHRSYWLDRMIDLAQAQVDEHLAGTTQNIGRNVRAY